MESTQISLGDLADVTIGVTFRGSDATHHSPDGTHQLVRIGDVSTSGIIDTQKVNLVKVDDRSIAKYELRRGDIILASRGERMPIAVYDLPIKAIVGSQFFIIRLNDSRLTPAYLRWFLSIEPTQRTLVSMLKGSYIKSLSKESLTALRVPVPPLDKQNVIVELNKLLQLESDILLRLSQTKPLLLNQSVLNKIS